MAASSQILISSTVAAVVSAICLIYDYAFWAALAAFASGSGWAFFVATKDIEKEIERLKGAHYEQKITSIGSGD